MPFDTDPDWPKDLRDAGTEYRKAWRTKVDEMNDCIEANAEQEELVDHPEGGEGHPSREWPVHSGGRPAARLGDFGTWDFLICHKVEQLPARLEEFAKREILVSLKAQPREIAGAGKRPRDCLPRSSEGSLQDQDGT